jgi:hypothetical protein
MSDKFKFALGAAVVLVTSASIVLDQLEMEAEDAARPKQDEGDDLIMGRMVMGIVEEGEIIGRSEFLKAGERVEGDYLVRYRDGSGRQVERWHSSDGVTTHEEIEAEFKRQQEEAQRAAEPERQGGFDQTGQDGGIGSDTVRGSGFGEEGGGAGASVLQA